METRTIPRICGRSRKPARAELSLRTLHSPWRGRLYVRCQELATELDCKRGGCGRIGKIPAKIILVIFSATATKACLYAALGMKFMHRFELLAEAAPRYGHLDSVRKCPLKDIGASATFVASHGLTGSRSLRRLSNSLAPNQAAWPLIRRLQQS